MFCFSVRSTTMKHVPPCIHVKAQFIITPTPQFMTALRFLCVKKLSIANFFQAKWKKHKVTFKEGASWSAFLRTETRTKQNAGSTSVSLTQLRRESMLWWTSWEAVIASFSLCCLSTTSSCKRRHDWFRQVDSRQGFLACVSGQTTRSQYMLWNGLELLHDVARSAKWHVEASDQHKRVRDSPSQLQNSFFPLPIFRSHFTFWPTHLDLIELCWHVFNGVLYFLCFRGVLTIQCLQDPNELFSDLKGNNLASLFQNSQPEMLPPKILTLSWTCWSTFHFGLSHKDTRNFSVFPFCLATKQWPRRSPLTFFKSSTFFPSAITSLVKAFSWSICSCGSASGAKCMSHCPILSSNSGKDAARLAYKVKVYHSIKVYSFASGVLSRWGTAKVTSSKVSSQICPFLVFKQRKAELSSNLSPWDHCTVCSLMQFRSVLPSEHYCLPPNLQSSQNKSEPGFGMDKSQRSQWHIPRCNWRSFRQETCQITNMWKARFDDWVKQKRKQER